MAQTAARAAGTAARTVEVDPAVTGRGNGTRLRRGDPPVASRSVPNVDDVTGASAGKPWELVPVVSRWIMQLGTV
ncbi:hypothetical protein DY000_02041644 [Brassica cretica]|uniref:Uncharacterized protein n=1 Tax=Brassica cretica TaxID=69181 RepID=A0ABQ7BP87_BRACR|nr:hypothetical protein DY000_02041644 [Brassica cretica]